MSKNATVFVVDDDQAVRNSIEWLLTSVGLQVRTFPDGQAFLESYESDQAGCVVIDVRLPGASGLEVHEALRQGGYAPPVIIISGHADVPMAVRALKAGAVDFIEKPFNQQQLLDSIQRAIRADDVARHDRATAMAIAERMTSLSPREREVLDHVVAGMLNKQIAQELNIAEGTVETHRSNVMTKMNASSFAELLHMAYTRQLIEQNGRYRPDSSLDS